MTNDSAMSFACHLCQSASGRELFGAAGRRYRQCEHCGLIARAVIEAAGVSAEYRNDAYQRQQAAYQLDRREAMFQRMLDEMARLRAPGRLLDVGCGDGLFLQLAQARGWQSSGVEPSPMAAEQARRRLLPAGQAGGGPDNRVICDELPHAHFSSGYFDAVTLFNVLDQMAAPLDHLREVHRVLKPGGLLLARVPNAAFHVGLLRLCKALERQLIVHLYSFSAATLRALLARAGFGEIRIRNSPLTPGDPYGISPALGETGMQWIKGTVFAGVQAMSALSGRRLLLGPSLMAQAVKSSRPGAA
ncbi:MAG: class I SAM-dependent methyltransferase [Nitrospirota bacterium]